MMPPHSIVSASQTSLAQPLKRPDSHSAGFRKPSVKGYIDITPYFHHLKRSAPFSRILAASNRSYFAPKPVFRPN